MILGMSFTDEQWKKALRNTFVATKCVKLWETSHKIMLRWYFTPHRISNFVKQASPLCWRACGYRGTLHHILWECPVLHKVWQKVFNLISEIAGSLVTPEAAIAVLSLGIENIPANTRTIVTHILLSTRLAILR